MTRTPTKTRQAVALAIARRDLAAARTVVIARAAGKCERCQADCTSIPFSVHHRVPRGMGGTRSTLVNLPSNLLLLCGTGTTGCHGFVEQNRVWAREAGYLVANRGHAERIAVLLHGSRWVRLLSDGSYEDATEASA